jgi:hypothetical protein
MLSRIFGSKGESKSALVKKEVEVDEVALRTQQQRQSEKLIIAKLNASSTDNAESDSENKFMAAYVKASDNLKNSSKARVTVGRPQTINLNLSQELDKVVNQEIAEEKKQQKQQKKELKKRQQNQENNIDEDKDVGLTSSREASDFDFEELFAGESSKKKDPVSPPTTPNQPRRIAYFDKSYLGFHSLPYAPEPIKRTESAPLPIMRGLASSK